MNDTFERFAHHPIECPCEGCRQMWAALEEEWVAEEQAREAAGHWQTWAGETPPLDL